MTCDFSQRHYEEILRQFLAENYTFSPFEDIVSRFPQNRCVVLRHDIDHSLEYALELAEIEHSLGISATYFVLLHTEFYNACSVESVAIIRKISALHHEIGLHYDTSYYRKYCADAVQAITKDVELLSDIVGKETRIGSQHNVIGSPFDEEIRKILPIDAYNFLSYKGMIYISDSGMKWRKECVCQLIDKADYIQVALHPLYWRVPGNTMKEKFDRIIEHEMNKVKTLYHTTYDYYQECLKSREAVDKQIQERLEPIT